MTSKTESRVCMCCGSNFFAQSYRVKKGLALFCSMSCAAKSRKPKHGHTTHKWQSRTYSTYTGMISRCHRPNNSKYAMYGGVGIEVCEYWRESFANFLADMGERPENTTIDRIDGSLGYFKENCRWATVKEQQANLKTNVKITFNGVTKNVSAWAEELGIDKTNLAWRIKNGWPIDAALTVSAKYGNRFSKNGQRLYEYEGKTQCVSEWAREFGLSISLLRLRLSKGWGIEEALKTPKGRFVVKGDHLLSSP